MDLLLPKHADTHHVAGIDAVFFAIDCFTCYTNSMLPSSFPQPDHHKKFLTILVAHELQLRCFLGDRQWAFNSPVFIHFMASLGCKLTLVSTECHIECNGISERILAVFRPMTRVVLQSAARDSSF